MWLILKFELRKIVEMFLLLVKGHGQNVGEILLAYSRWKSSLAATCNVQWKYEKVLVTLQDVLLCSLFLKKRSKIPMSCSLRLRFLSFSKVKSRYCVIHILLSRMDKSWDNYWRLQNF